MAIILKRPMGLRGGACNCRVTSYSILLLVKVLVLTWTKGLNGVALKAVQYYILLY
jgi:hypothetical protein